MRTLKHWYQENYDDKQTMIEFIAYQVANMESASSILRMIREAHPEIEIGEQYDNDEFLRSLVKEYLNEE